MALMYKRSRVRIRAELIFLFFLLLAVLQKCFARSCNSRISSVMHSFLFTFLFNVVPVWLICRPYSYRRFSLLTRRCKTSCFKKFAQNLLSHIHVPCVFFFFVTSTFPIMPPPPLCFSFLPGIAAVPREIENNAYAKIWGSNKAHYRKCGSGVNVTFLLISFTIIWARLETDRKNNSLGWDNLSIRRAKQKAKNNVQV